MVLVTGGAGFIGSEVVRQLCQRGHSVTVIDNFTSGKADHLHGLDIKLIKGDICDSEVLFEALKDQEQVVHLAALPFIPDSYVAPEQFFRVNAMGTVSLIRHAIRSESVEKFVHISSSEVYGAAKYVPMDEEHPTLPHSTYAASKLAADRAAYTIHKEHGFPVVILRPFNSYGPRVTQPYIIPEIITQLLRADTVLLGNTETSRDFTYVGDTAKGIIAACGSKEAIGETINLASGTEVRIKELVVLISKLLGKGEVSVQHDESRMRPYDVDRLVGDYSKAQKILGWKPEVSLSDGLERTIEWIRQHPEVILEPFRGWRGLFDR